MARTSDVVARSQISNGTCRNNCPARRLQTLQTRAPFLVDALLPPLFLGRQHLEAALAAERHDFRAAVFPK